MNLSKALGMAIPALEHRAVFYDNLPEVTREYNEAVNRLRQEMKEVDASLRVSEWTPTNPERAKRGKSALNFYGVVMLNEGNPAPELDQDTLTDLLTDLLHHCDASGLDWLHSLQRAGEHWEAEKAGEVEV